MLALSWRTPRAIARLIGETQALTSCPFGVNLVIEWPQEERLRACLDAGVKMISFFWGDPTELWKIAHDAGALVLHQVGSVEEAARSRDAGTDVIVAQGFEAGGHVRGTTAGAALLGRVIAAVTPLPVVAAGGIADTTSVARAVAAGAAGIWVGTRFVASVESAAHPYYKQRIVDAAASDAVYTMAFDGGWENAPHRAIRNSTVEMFERGAIERAVVAHFPNGDPIRRFDDTPPITGMTGDLEALALYAGESAGMIHGILPASEIVKELSIPWYD